MTHAAALSGGDHSHDVDFTVADDPGEMYGESGVVDMKPVGMLIGAAYDDCEPCIDQALAEVSAVPARVRRVMELAYVFADQFGVTDEMVGDATNAAGYSPEFRAVMRAGVKQQNQALTTIVNLSPAGRRNAVHDAAKVVVSFLPH